MIGEKSNKELLSASDVADLLSISYRTVMWWIQEKKIPSYRFGRHERVKRDELLEWIKNCRSEVKV